MFPGFEPVSFARSLAALRLPPPIEVRPLGRTLVNHTWVLVFPETARVPRMVLRAVLADPGVGGVGAERAALRMVHLLGDLPVPREFAVLEPGWSGPALSLASWLPGTNGADLVAASPEGGAAAFREVGRVVAALEDGGAARFATRATHAGEFLPRAADWAGEVEALAEGVFAQGERTSPGALFARLAAALREGLPALATADRWALVHGDLHPGNLLLEGEGADLALSGVVDWDRAALGDPGMEWASALQLPTPALGRVLEGYGRERARALLEPDGLARLDLYLRLRCLGQLALAGLPVFGRSEGAARALALERALGLARVAAGEEPARSALTLALEAGAQRVRASVRPPAHQVLRRQALEAFRWSERFGAAEGASLSGALAAAALGEGTADPRAAEPTLLLGVRLIPRHDATTPPLPGRSIADRAVWRGGLIARVLGAFPASAAPVPCGGLVVLALALDAVDRVDGAVSDSVLRGVEAVVEGALVHERMLRAGGAPSPDRQLLHAWLGAFALETLGLAGSPDIFVLFQGLARASAAGWGLLEAVSGGLHRGEAPSAGGARDPLEVVATLAMARGVAPPGIAASGAVVLGALRGRVS